MPITRANLETADRARATTEALAGHGPAGAAAHRHPGGTALPGGQEPAHAAIAPKVTAAADRAPVEIAHARVVPASARGISIPVTMPARLAKPHGPRQPR